MVTIPTPKERAIEILNRISSMLPLENEDGCVAVAKNISFYMIALLKDEAINTLDGRREFWNNIKNEIEKID